MTSPYTRRQTLMLGSSLLGLAACTALRTPAPSADPAAAQQARRALHTLERQAGGRLGVYCLDFHSGQSVGHRADERQALCSTFKLLLAGLVLQQARAGAFGLNDTLRFNADDLVPHAPVVTQHLDAGQLSILELARAAQQTSDNVAANLLLRHLGGPAAFTRHLRAWGDRTTRLDRLEPEMNRVPAGELRDTTTPAAMARTVAQLVDGQVLHPDDRSTLQSWMVQTTTGQRRLRAGLPAEWLSGDKTGTGIAPEMGNQSNDVAVIWPQTRRPWVIAAYYSAAEHQPRMQPLHDAVLAEVGRIAARWWAATAAAHAR